MVVSLAALSMGFVPTSDNDTILKISRGLDIFGKAYREIAFRYIEPVDPEELMKYGIDQMLESLDPYTVFIDDIHGDELELLTNGRYGGIGITVGSDDSAIVVSNVMEGFAADRAGIHVDDVIIAVDSVDIRSKRINDVRAMVRGAAGTTVRLRVRREESPAILDFTMVREEIVLKNVTCAQLIGNKIGYIKLEHFTRGAGEEVRSALRDLRAKGATRVVLDLRDNPGGLLDQAVSVVEQFVPRGNLIVSTRGRSTEADHQYFSEQEPIAPDLPLVVLVNRESASASEIVAGAIQDLDRGLIVGTRTFGKGLVQTVTPLPYNTSIKITTAKYYTPSGRCIQEIDYGHRKGEFFIAFPDSGRKTFFTAKKRPVLEEGGVSPDSAVSATPVLEVIAALDRKYLVRQFFNHESDTAALARMPAAQMTEKFIDYLHDQHYQYSGRLTIALDSALLEAKNMKLSDELHNQLEHLRTQIGNDWETELLAHREALNGRLSVGREYRLHGTAAATVTALQNDPMLQAAQTLLGQPKRMEIKLGYK